MKRPVDQLPEGAEAPPPGVRTMAVVRWLLVSLMALVAAGAWVYWAETAPAAVATARYRCPMHPSVVRTAPGECPICGMDLVAVADDHGSEGGQEGAAARTNAPLASAGSERKYWCPMHPEVTSDDPDARCTKCGGMRLVPQHPSEASHPGRQLPGLAPVEIGAERSQRAGIRTTAVARAHVGAELRTTGVVSASEASLATVTARSTGWVDDLLVKEGGAKVRRGQVLATLYSPDLINAQQVFLSAVRLNQTQGATAYASSGANAFADAAKRLELLGIARQDIAKLRETGQVVHGTPVRAPIDGFVSRRSAYAGQPIQPGTELFQVVDLSSVWVIADVFESELGRVRVEQRARLTLAAYPGETFTGRVEFIYPAVNGASRTLQARIALRNPELKLRPGMYADIVLESAPVDALVVPSEAVVDTGERRYVFVAREAGRFEPRPVRVGVRSADRVQLLEGVTEGEQVVTSASFLVDSESRLRAAVEAFAPAAALEREEHPREHQHQLAQGGRDQER